MLSIRLTRTGKIHAPHYRIVVQEKRSKLNGKAVDIIGHYHPASPDKLLVVDHEKAKKWIGLGAQASDTVVNLLVKEGLMDKARKISGPVMAAKVKEVKEVKKEVVAEETPAEEAVVEEASPEVATEEAVEAPVAAEETTEE